MGATTVIKQWMLRLDQDATRQRVEDALETARIYKFFGPLRREAKITPSYDDTPRSITNTVSKPTEDCAVWNADTEAKMRECYESVEKAVRRLPAKQREIISKKYLESIEEINDYNLYHDVHLSERTYRRVKTKAIFNLAFALRLEVWEEPEMGTKKSGR